MANNFISCLAWVSRGYALKIPKEHELEDSEIEQMKQDPKANKNLKKDLSNIVEIEEDSDEDKLPVFCQDVEQFARQGYDDEYPVAFEDMSDEEREDYQIKSSDALIIAAKIENQYSSLEIYVYEEDKSNLFVHHEIELSAFPLAVEWLKIQPGQIETTRGNFAVVSTFLEGIEIWDLDIMNVIEPTLILGGEIEQSSNKVKNLKKKNKQFKPDILNKFKPNILLSGSADKTVKIWDIAKNTCVFTYRHHTEKVQVTRFNTVEESILLTAAEDQQLAIFDARSPTQIHGHKLVGSIESACWDPINGYNIAYSTEQGNLVLLDARKIQEHPVSSFNVYKKALSSVAMSFEVPGLLATTCLDGKIRIFDTQQLQPNGQLKQVSIYNPKLDNLFCGAFYQDSPWIFACGSEKGEIFVWDLAEDLNIVQHFGDRMPNGKKPNIGDCTQQGQEDFCQLERAEQQKADQMEEEEQFEDQ
ncbi:hypothetical protein pb186bvf_009555 [Paramecium bursaria]